MNVGDLVYCKEKKKQGKVEAIGNIMNTFPVKVKFEDGEECLYSFTGQFDLKIERSLFFVRDCIFEGWEFKGLKEKPIPEKPYFHCRCDIYEVMRNGCKCGAFRNEQNAKKR